MTALHELVIVSTMVRMVMLLGFSRCCRTCLHVAVLDGDVAGEDA